jgi:hypothetical protein
MSELYNLIFFPTVKPGEDEAEVKDRLASRLKVDQGKVESWFETGKPTLLLKDVAPDVADRYMQAILDCGGSCNMQPSGSDGKGSLSLIPKPANVELFVCPSCEYEEELEPGESYEQCPKCDLVIAKWAEKQEEEKKKEEIRRRLLRDARFRDEGADEAQRKKDELAELRRLEAEIMKELGIKPPSKLWQMFSKRPVSISASVGILLVTLSSAISYYVSDYFDAQKEAEFMAAPPSEEIQQLAPAMAGAVGLQLSGNQQMVDELAQATQLLTGQGMNAQALTKAAEQMMKGAGNSDFIEQANASTALKSSTPGGLGEPAPVSVNRDTLGGVVGLPGVDDLSTEQLAETRPGSVDHGFDEVSGVLTYKIQMPDPANPNGPDIMVDQIDRLDGSKVVALLKNLSKDLEWDHFLKAQVVYFLDDDRWSQASELADMIKNPGVRAEALIAAIERLARDDPYRDFKLPLARLGATLNDIESFDLRARYWLQMADKLVMAAVPDQPQDIFRRMSDLADDAKTPADRAMVLARLAVGYVRDADNGEAKRQFKTAMVAASSAPVLERVKAFSKIANRYYDARNLTLAGEILAEAEVLAATELLTADRAAAFSSIAAAQLYQGDVVGAMNAIDNAATGAARQQLLAQQIAWLIDEGEIFQAQNLISRLTDPVLQQRLAVRLISRVANRHSQRKARALLAEYAPRPGAIANQTEEALLFSQFARLHLRLRQPDQAVKLFDDALAIADRLEGRKGAVTRGMIALDQARGLWIGRAKDTLERVTELIVLEPISSEIVATERTIKNQLPKAIQERAVASN